MARAPWARAAMPRGRRRGGRARGLLAAAAAVGALALGPAGAGAKGWGAGLFGVGSGVTRAEARSEQEMEQAVQSLKVLERDSGAQFLQQLEALEDGRENQDPVASEVLRGPGGGAGGAGGGGASSSAAAAKKKRPARRGRARGLAPQKEMPEPAVGSAGAYPRWCGGAPASVLPWGARSPTQAAVKGLDRTPAQWKADAGKGSVGKLKACLRSIDKCDLEAARAARQLVALRRYLGSPRIKIGNAQKVRTCALVGNSGHLLRKAYGKYIDNHDYIVRMNVISTGGRFSYHVGKKTSLRFINKSRSASVCSRTSRLPEMRHVATGGKLPSTIILWHPEGRARIARCLRRKLKSVKILALRRSTSRSIKSDLMRLRANLKRIGMGPFESALQVTSGMHATLMLGRMCDHISIYGTTTYRSSRRGPDQYGGRAKKIRTGQNVHDWKGEPMVWKLFHASGKMSICSV